MKINKYIISLLLVSFALGGCSNWLDIQPKDQVKKNKMFETVEGFRSVLTGTYIRMKGDYMYGGELTWGWIEYMAQHWTTQGDTPGDHFSKYNYTAVENQIGLMYQVLYKVIADVNGILENIDAKKDLLSDGNYELIKGEALGLRAYCHFNILQLFGAVPSLKASSNRMLTYVKEISKEIQTSYSFDDYVALTLADLDEAEELLKQVDPICEYSIYDLNHLSMGSYTPADDFWPYRQHRMNYYAVLGEKARVYQWAGNGQKAAEYALKVIDAKDQNGKLMYKLGLAEHFLKKDFTLSCEHIFNIHMYNFTDIAASNFAEMGVYEQKQANINELYDETDLRQRYLWVELQLNETTRYLTKKYWQDRMLSYESEDVVPQMRLSEMYFIAIENSPERGAELYRNFCSTRGSELEPYGDADELKRMLIKEYNREFYAEGKMFYVYKHFAVPASGILWNNGETTKELNEIYVLPLPKREIIIGK